MNIIHSSSFKTRSTHFVALDSVMLNTGLKPIKVTSVKKIGNSEEVANEAHGSIKVDLIDEMIISDILAFLGGSPLFGYPTTGVCEGSF